MEHKKIGSENQDSYDDQQKWVLDSSFDSKGHVPLRARTGAWRAAFFIIGNKTLTKILIQKLYSIYYESKV